MSEEQIKSYHIRLKLRDQTILTYTIDGKEANNENTAVAIIIARAERLFGYYPELYEIFETNYVKSKKK